MIKRLKALLPASIKRPVRTSVETLVDYAPSRSAVLRGRGHGLEWVVLETHGHCTNDCFMCPGRISEQKRGRLQEHHIKKAIDSLARISYTGHLQLMGQCEPPADTRIFDLIGYARRRLPNASLDLISNFTVMSDSIRKKLLAAPLTRLTTSIYALDARTYQEICGRDNFARMMRNLIAFSKEWADIVPYDFTLYCIDSQFTARDEPFIDSFMRSVPCSSAHRTPLSYLRGMHQRVPTPQFFGECLYSNLKVAADGQISLCTADPDSLFHVGHIESDDLVEAYRNDRARELRLSVFWGRHQREHASSCGNCDSNAGLHHKGMYFLPLPASRFPIRRESPSRHRYAGEGCSNSTNSFSIDGVEWMSERWFGTRTRISLRKSVLSKETSRAAARRDGSRPSSVAGVSVHSAAALDLWSSFGTSLGEEDAPLNTTGRLDGSGPTRRFWT